MFQKILFWRYTNFFLTECRTGERKLPCQPARFVQPFLENSDFKKIKIKKSKSKSFIRYGSNACWIHTITIKYKYKLYNKT